MKNIFIFIFIFSINTLASSLSSCSQYELESDERFEIKTIEGDSFLTIYSKSFDASFFLKCPNATNIYAKILESNFDDKDDLLQIETNAKIESIEISNYQNQGYIKEIKFSIDNKMLSSLTEENIIHIKKDKNKDTLYQLRKTNKNKSSLPLNFQCNEQYFFNKYKLKSLSFENEKLDVSYIVKSILKWKVLSQDKDDKNDEKIVSWFIDCQKWADLTKKNNLEDMASLDKQIVLQASKAHKKSKILLGDLQESTIYNREPSKDILQKFTETMNALKTLEKNKSEYKVFNNINNIFYIKNDKDLRSKLDYILSYAQSSYYYDLLSNVKIGSFSDLNKFDLEFIPIRISVFASSKNKDFLVIRLDSRIKLISENTQFITYKLSNSFCSSLSNNIDSINKQISGKVKLIGYCYDKKIGNTYSKSKPSLKNKKYVPTQTYKAPLITKNITNKIINKNDKVKCKDIENGVLCKNVAKEQISIHIKNNLNIPSLDELIENFDKEEFENSTIYAPNNKYFFYDEDSGWISRDESDSNTIDLILTR